MKVTSCVPLAGQGVIARYGALVGVTDARGPDPDPLLSVLAEAAAAGGDGGDLVPMAARAALGCRGQPAWACAGVTADGGLAVLVHGHAVATVRVDGGPEVTLAAGDSVNAGEQEVRRGDGHPRAGHRRPRRRPTPSSGSATAWCAAAASR